jgi:hypothetical protein
MYYSPICCNVQVDKPYIMLCLVSTLINRIVIVGSLEQEYGKCRIYACNEIGIPGKLGLCPTHYDEYEEVKQEIIQDDYYS